MREDGGYSVNQRWMYIDALKGLAMLMVIAAHCINNNLLENIQAILGNGRHGVQIFFVVSGLLTAISINKLHLDSGEHQSRRKVLLEWMKKKIKNIAPVYYSVIFFILALNCLSGITGHEYLATYWLGEEKSISITNVLTHILFINAFFPHYINSIIGVEWYIADLLIFYIIYAFFLERFCTNKKNIIRIIVFLIIFMYLLKYFDRHIAIYDFDAHIYGSYINTFNIMAQLPCLLMGGYISHFFINNVENKSYKLLGIAGWTMLLLMLLNVLHITESLMDVMYGISASCILLGMRSGISCFQYFLLEFIGKYSLEIYLTHILFIDAWNKYIYPVMPNEFAFVDYLLKYCVIVATSIMAAMILRKCQGGR